MHDLLVTRQHTDAATLLHPSQVFLSFFHVSVDLVHTLLDSVQLFCSKLSSKLSLITKQRKSTCTFATRFWLFFKLTFTKLLNLRIF